jgi:iron-sulfur cluster assembly protein
MVTLEPKALEHVIELMKEGGLTPDTHNLRVGIKGGGCSGLSYTMDFDDKIEVTDEVVQADGLKVVIDRKDSMIKQILYLVSGLIIIAVIIRGIMYSAIKINDWLSDDK